jgi:hypothetical protein
MKNFKKKKNDNSADELECNIKLLMSQHLGQKEGV